jgi:carbonic anhydrase
MFLRDKPERFPISTGLRSVRGKQLVKTPSEYGLHVKRKDDLPIGQIAACRVREERATTYVCKQVDFHAPSEHKIRGFESDLELQVYCKTDLVDDKRNEAIVSFLFKETKSKQSNPFFEDLFERNTLDFSHLDEDLTITDYYLYNGSHTTPPCEETVTWFVSAEIYGISKA